MGRGRFTRLLLVAFGVTGCSTSREPPGVEAALPPTSETAAPVSAEAPPPAAASPPATASASATASTVAPAPPAPPPGDRIYAKARFVWIQAAPRASRGWIGYLTLGGSVRLKNGNAAEAKTLGPGCDAWYAIEPTGYVCLGPETTLDPEDPVYLALAAHAANVADPFPFHYGESTGTPRYEKVPSPAAQREREWDLDEHRSKLATLGVDASPAGEAFPELPSMSPLVREARASVARGSTVAWSRSYDAAERTWLYTSDHALVPKDRVIPYPRRTYRGVELGKGIELPIAFFRKKDRPQYKRDGEAFVPTGESYSRLSHVMLTGREVKAGATTYLETKDAGIWVDALDAAVASVRSPVPYRADEAPGGRRTWLDISILTGTLVAYENETPVFATLISPGRGGLPVKGYDYIATASTPVGTFRVDGKFRTATMVSSTDSSIVHADVQFVQNFHGAHALHGAYWHDAWGELKSGGCVNLSPIDSKWVFDWTEPKLPADWHGLRSTDDLGPPTRVVVRP